MNYNILSCEFIRLCNLLKEIRIIPNGNLSLYAEDKYISYIKEFMNSNTLLKDCYEITIIGDIENFNEVNKIVKIASEENILSDMLNISCKSIVLTETFLDDDLFYEFKHNNKIYFFSDLFEFMNFILEHLKKQ